MAKYEKQMCKQSHLLPRKRLFKRVSACVRRLHIQVLGRSALKGGGSHFVSCQHDERLSNSLINDQENVEIVAFKSWARMSALETSATCNAAARSLRSLAHQIVLRDVRESFFFFVLFCLDLLVWQPRFELPDVPLSLYQVSHLRCCRKFHPAPTTRLVSDCYVRKPVQFPPPPMCPSISDKSEQVQQCRCSLMLNLLQSVVIREKPCVSFPRLRPRRTGCAIFGVYEGIIGGKQ